MTHTPFDLRDAALLMQHAYRLHARYRGALPCEAVFNRWFAVPWTIANVQAVDYLPMTDDGEVDNHGARVLVIPGTNELGDWWKTNFRVRRVRQEALAGRWHVGFLRAAAEVYDARSGQATDLHLVGHSMGSAVAGSLAAGLARDGQSERIRSIHLLEAPRFCDAEAAEWLTEVYGDRAVRVRVGVDPVVDLPPWMCAPFREHVISGNGDVVSRPRRLRELWRAIRQPGLQVVQHHSIDELVRRVLAPSLRPWWEEPAAVRARMVDAAVATVTGIGGVEPWCDDELCDISLQARRLAAIFGHCMSGRPMGELLDEITVMYPDPRSCHDCGADRHKLSDHSLCLVDRPPIEVPTEVWA